MRITQRQVDMGLLGLLTVGAFLLFVSQIIGQRDPLFMTPTGMTFLAFGILFFGYWRGWVLVRYITVILTTLLLAFALQEPFLTKEVSLSIFIPPIIALVMIGPPWVIGSAILSITMLIVRAGGQGIYTAPQLLVLYAMIIGGMMLTRFVTEAALNTAEANERRARQSQLRAEQQAHELAETNERLNAHIAQQRQLIDLVATLETPAVTLAEGVLFAPIIGHLDPRRAETLTARLLQEAHIQRTRLVVLDVAGVAMVDTQVARALMETAQALRLLGCKVTISGVTANIAMALLHLGVNLDEVQTARSPQEALMQYLESKATRPNGNGAAQRN